MGIRTSLDEVLRKDKSRECCTNRDKRGKDWRMDSVSGE